MKVNKRRLAEILGTTERTLTEWQDQGLPIKVRGERGQDHEYDCPTVIAWMIEREVQKRSRAESQRDRLTRLQADAQELELLEKKRELLPAGEIEPAWRHRVLTAAAFLAGQHSRLAGILEGTPGVEGKRKVLREEFSQFLNRLGVDGERMQDEVAGLLGRVSDAEAAAFLKRISSHEPPANAAGATAGAGPSGPSGPVGPPSPDGARAAEPGVVAVRPAEEGPAV